MTTSMTRTGLPEMAGPMPSAIQFEVHHSTRARRARLHAAPPRRADALLCGTEHRTRAQATNFKETHHALIARTRQDGIAAAAIDPH